MAIKCPHCRKSIGGRATEGGFRVRLGIVLLDPESGIIKGPCPHCKRTIELTESAKISKNINLSTVVPAFRITKA